MFNLESLLKEEDFESLGPIVGGAMKAHREQQREMLSKALVRVFAETEGWINGQVRVIRQARKAEAEAKKRLKKASRAKAYFQATGNPLPLFDAFDARGAAYQFCREVNSEVPQNDSDLWKVPADFDENQSD